MNELVNTWDDWNPQPFDQSGYPPPTYTPNEVAKILCVSSALAAFCDATPDPVVDALQAQQLPEWRKLVDAAQSAYSEIMFRSRSPEE